MITIDIANHYYNSLENLALLECRKEQTRKLIQLLIEPDET